MKIPHKIAILIILVSSVVALLIYIDRSDLESKTSEHFSLEETEIKATSQIKVGDYGPEYDDWKKYVGRIHEKDFLQKMSNTLKRLEAERDLLSDSSSKHAMMNTSIDAVESAIKRYYLGYIPSEFVTVSSSTIFNINQKDLYELTYGNKNWGIDSREFPKFETDRFYFNEAGISFEYITALGKPKVTGSVYPCIDSVNNGEHFSAIVGYDSEAISNYKNDFKYKNCISYTVSQSGKIEGFKINYSIYVTNKNANTVDDLTNKEGPSYEDVVAAVTLKPVDDSFCNDSNTNNNPFRPYPTHDCKIIDINGKKALFKFDLITDGIGDHQYYLYSFYQSKNDTSISIVPNNYLNELNFKVVDYVAKSVKFENVEPVKEFSLDYAIKDVTTEKDDSDYFFNKMKNKAEVLDENPIIKFDAGRMSGEFKITESNLIAWEWQNLEQNAEASGNFPFDLMFYVVDNDGKNVCFINRIYDVGKDLTGELRWRPTGGNCRPLVFSDEYRIKVVKDMYGSRGDWHEKNEFVTFSEPFKFVAQ